MEDLSSSSKAITLELAEKLLRPLMEVRMGMEAKLSGGDGGTPFILHRNQWSRLVKLFSTDLDFIKHKLEDILKIFIASLRCLFSVMEAARISFEECIAPHARGYFRLDGSSSGRGEEYVWTGPELGDAEEEEEEEQRKRRREDLRVWIAKHALRHTLDHEIPHRHADNFRTASMAHIILYSPLLRHCSGTEEMMSELCDDTREARAFFSHEEMVKIDISPLLLHRLRGDENVEAAVERLFVDPAEFRKCNDDSGSGKLGEGGYGSVKLRKWISDDHHVAVKKGDLGRQEMGIQARVRHPNLLPLLCCSTGKRTGKEEMAFLPVMERMDSSLDKLIISTSWTAFILEVETMLQIAKGMEYLHSLNIVHRDLKPANILVSGYPDADVLKIPELLRLRLAFLRVKVADFGVSKDNFQTSHSSNTLKVGTGFYRAPEVLEGSRNSRRKWRIGQISRSDGYSRKADVYSFAMVCYRILTGKEPFHGDSRPEYVLRQKIRDEALRPKFDQFYPWPALVGMVEECWQQDASRRPDFVEIVKFIRFVKICALQHEFNFKSRPPQPAEVLYVAINRREELFREFRDVGFNLVHMLDQVAYRSQRG